MRLWSIAICLTLGACAAPGPRINRAAYSGPPLSVDSTGAKHTIVLEAPTTGWSISLDQAHRQFEATDVFVTIVRPDPAYMHAQVVTAHRLDSSVEARTNIRLFARILKSDETGRSRPYQEALQVAGHE